MIFNFKSNNQPQRVVTRYDNSNLKSVVYIVKGKPYDRHINFYNNGHVKDIYHYLDGKLNGNVICFDENGRLKSRTFYNNDEIVKVTDYYPNGAVETISYYENGKLDFVKFMSEDGSYVRRCTEYSGSSHTSLRYDKFGRIIQRTPSKDGRTHGIETYYFYNEDGSYRYTETSFEDGLKHGTEKRYDEDGQLYQENLYRNNQLVDKKSYNVSMPKLRTTDNLKITRDTETDNVIEECYYDDDNNVRHIYQYYPNGKIKSAKHFVNDKETGLSVLYREDGHVSTIGRFTDGKKNGDSIYYHSDGTLDGIAHYKDDKVDGMVVGYGPSGAEVTCCMYQNGQKNGLEETMSEDGTYVKICSPFVNGQLHGNVCIYDENLKFLEEIQYENGKRV